VVFLDLPNGSLNRKAKAEKQSQKITCLLEAIRNTKGIELFLGILTLKLPLKTI
jgi:hypothetical protein